VNQEYRRVDTGEVLFVVVRHADLLPARLDELRRPGVSLVDVCVCCH
jgi:hypothetical protein